MKVREYDYYSIEEFLQFDNDNDVDVMYIKIPTSLSAINQAVEYSDDGIYHRYGFKVADIKSECNVVQDYVDNSINRRILVINNSQS